MVYLEKDPRFYNRIKNLSESVGISPEDLLVVMTLESGINPTIHNNNYGGLVQMSNNTLKGLGYSGNVSDFSKEPAYKQLDFVEKQINKLKSWLSGDFETAEQYYLGNLLPVSLKLEGVRNKDVNTIIVSKNPTTPHLPGVSIEKEKIYYNSNQGLDLDKDGSITYGDIKNFLDKKRNESHYKHAMEQMKSVVNYEPVKNEINEKATKIENTPSNSNKIYDMINSLIDKMANLKKKDNITIKISSNNEDISTDFARILSMAIKEDLNIKSLLFKDNTNLEIVCNAHSITKKTLINTLSSDIYKDYCNHILNLHSNLIVELTNSQTINKPLLYKDSISSYRRMLIKSNFKG